MTDITYRIGERVVILGTGTTGVITARRINPLSTNYVINGVEYTARQLRPLPARARG